MAIPKVSNSSYKTNRRNSNGSARMLSDNQQRYKKVTLMDLLRRHLAKAHPENSISANGLELTA